MPYLKIYLDFFLGNLHYPIKLKGGERMEKKEYEKPELVEYEDLRSLTGGDLELSER